jgi:hypothetical protein
LLRTTILFSSILFIIDKYKMQKQYPITNPQQTTTIDSSSYHHKKKYRLSIRSDGVFGLSFLETGVVGSSRRGWGVVG